MTFLMFATLQIISRILSLVNTFFNKKFKFLICFFESSRFLSFSLVFSLI